MNKFVFNIGLNKSGTSSLTEALNILGIKSLHYKTEKGILLEKIISKNKKSNKNLFYSLDHIYQGFSDFGGENCYKDLYCQYPNSKFIFTTRYFPDWFNSYAYDIPKVFPKKFKTVEATRKQFIEASYHYFNKTKQIKKFFKDKPDQFLEMKICEGDGWHKLCPFLELDIPDVPFPHLNKNIYLKKY